MPGPRYRMVATTQRISDAVSRNAGFRPAVLAHLPLPEPGDSDDRSDVGPDVRRALDRMNAMPSLLVFGAMHGKKHLELIAGLPEFLPAGWQLVVAGAPLVDGVAVYAELERASGAQPVVTIAREVTDAEVRALMAAAAAALVPQRAGEASMSGVLLDTIAAEIPVIAPMGSSAGDVVEGASLGSTYRVDDWVSIGPAVVAAGERFRPDTSVLARHGILPAEAWAQAVVAQIPNGTGTARA